MDKRSKVAGLSATAGYAANKIKKGRKINIERIILLMTLFGIIFNKIGNVIDTYNHNQYLKINVYQQELINLKDTISTSVLLLINGVIKGLPL